eukprot:jgi/Mesen1/5290/ME000263S04398
MVSFLCRCTALKSIQDGVICEKTVEKNRLHPGAPTMSAEDGQNRDTSALRQEQERGQTVPRAPLETATEDAYPAGPPGEAAIDGRGEGSALAHADDDDDDEEPPEAIPIFTVETDPAAAPVTSSDGGGGESAKVSLPPPVPITIITGYLGAGKTTLVNYVLTAKHGQRIAVIVNEFGMELGMERALVSEGADAALVEEWVELGNGCMCCSTKGGFLLALEQLMERRDKYVRHVLLETSGLADPGPVAAALWADDALESSVRLDSIITVVDARNLRRQLHEPRPPGAVNEAARQLAFADTIILNKIDLLRPETAADAADRAADGAADGEGEADTCQATVGERAPGSQGGGELEAAEAATSLLELSPLQDVGIPGSLSPGELEARETAVRALEDEITSINQVAGIVRSVRCQVDLRHILHRDTFNPQCSSELEKLSEEEAAHGHTHDSQVGTVSFLQDGFADLHKVDMWLSRVLWEKAESADIYRMKGALQVAGHNRMHIFQAVHELYELKEGRPWGAGEDRQNRVVIIGKNLDREWLLSSFRSCLLPP